MKKQDITKKALTTLALTGLCAGLTAANQEASADEAFNPGNEYAFNACGSCSGESNTQNSGRTRRYNPATTVSDETNTTPDNMEQWPNTIDDTKNGAATDEKKTADATDDVNMQKRQPPTTPTNNTNGAPPHATCNSKHGCHNV